MPRPNNTFVPRGTVYAQGTKRDVLDLRLGGQYGWSPDFTTYVNSQPYVSRNVICLMLEEPKGLRKFQNADKWIGAYRSLLETKAKRIEGLQNSWEVQTTEVEFGGGGQVFEVFTDVKESRPNLNFVWDELDGMPIWRFHKNIINYLMMNPHTKYAMNNTIPGAELEDLLADQYGCTCAFLEPDANHKYINQGIIVTNMFPKGTGDNQMKRDKNSPGETREVSIPYAGLAQTGEGINEFLQEIFDRIRIHNADPERRRSFIREISARVADRNFGYGNSVTNISSQQTTF